MIKLTVMITAPNGRSMNELFEEAYDLFVDSDEMELEQRSEIEPEAKIEWKCEEVGDERTAQRFSN